MLNSMSSTTKIFGLQPQIGESGGNYKIDSTMLDIYLSQSILPMFFMLLMNFSSIWFSIIMLF